MSITTIKTDSTGKFEDVRLLEINQKELLENKFEKVNWIPTDKEKLMRDRILKDLVKGTTNLWTPRIEFNDLSVIQRLQYDQMAFNSYQPNNGESADADDVNGWHSNAMRPIVRNKAISIAAHALARVIFPKIFAYNKSSDEESEAAEIMENLMEWAGDQSDYKYFALKRVIAALYEPASIGYTEYAETYHQVKVEKKDGKWTYKVELDKDYSGFKDDPVPSDELLIENFYEPNIQHQGFLIRRKIISYSKAKAKYATLYPKFNKYVREGLQCVYSDANQSFYYVYDPTMRQYQVEEIVYWNKALDVRIIMLNGIIINDADSPNPRNDKQYPFEKFGYELINNRCFYYKSLAFKLQQDANIVNTLYPMIIDGTYLQIMPPMFHRGEEVIASDVIVPGKTTSLTSKDSTLQAIQTSIMRMQDGLNVLQKVEDSVSESSQSETQQGNATPGSQTAYEISRIESNASTVLGLFIQMIAQHVKDFGKLRLSDILQYLTIAEVDKIEGGNELTYKTFLMHNQQTKGGIKSKKIVLTPDWAQEPMTKKTYLNSSYDLLTQEGGLESKTEISKVNPILFRNLTYYCTVSPDVLNPRSEDLERAYGLEFYDRLIANPLADQEEALRVLVSTNPNARRDPERFISKQQNPAQMAQDMNQNSLLNPKEQPLKQIASQKNKLPQQMPNLPV